MMRILIHGRARQALAALLALLVVTLACAGRPLPADAKRGELRSAEFPYVQIGATVMKLSPGAKIFDEANRLILPTRLPQRGSVAYQLEATTGMVIQIWLLTAEEAAGR